MGRKRSGRPLHGWIILDKPVGISSSAAVGRVRRSLDAAKVGHGGTLDPLASGILPLALGEATKTVSWVMDGSKTYTFTLRWGEAHSTDDEEGDVTETSDVRPTEAQILEALPTFIGEIEQMPPTFSALKIDGQRAYKLAREGKQVELKSRQVVVEEFALVDGSNSEDAAFRVVCGKGTYIRSLGRDLALHLGSVGHIRNLRRTAVGPFSEIQAISLDKLESLGHIAPDSGVLHPVETVLDDIPALALTEIEARRLKQGQGVPVLPVVNRASVSTLKRGDVICAMWDGKLVALTEIRGGELKPVRVMNH